MKIKLAYVQHACSIDLKENLGKSMTGIKEAARKGAKIVVLQELHRSLYFCQTEETRHFDLAETIPGETTELLGRLSKELKIVIVSSLFEKRAPGLYHNTAVVFDSGKTAGLYRKMHIPDDPGFSEKYYFTPGDLGFVPVQTSLCKIGVLICWDQWYPEAARLMALNGAELLVYPTAIGWDKKEDSAEYPKQLDAWLTAQRAHAVSNGLHVLSVNRVGTENDLSFWGNSFICGPMGEYLCRSSSDKEEVQVVEIDLSKTEETRRIWPFFRDRRIDFYQDLLKRYNQ